MPFLRRIERKTGFETRDPQLGKLMLYQLSYFRILIYVTKLIKT